MSEKYTFQDFLASVDGENQKFVSKLHDELTALGCKIDVKSAKSGYMGFLQSEQKDHRQLCVPQERADCPDLCGSYRPVHGDFRHAARQYGTLHPESADL